MGCCHCNNLIVSYNGYTLQQNEYTSQQIMYLEKYRMRFIKHDKHFQSMVEIQRPIPILGKYTHIKIETCEENYMIDKIIQTSQMFQNKCAFKKIC